MAPAAALDESGCLHWPAAASPVWIQELIASMPGEIGAGLRLGVTDAIVALGLQSMHPVATAHRPFAKPVRAVLFDKTARRNWAVPWHQDRTIAVRQRIDVDGFGPWSVKDGVVHVEPPFRLLADMVTLRLHLDDCLDANAPLRVALGSHRSRTAAANVVEEARSHRQLTCLAKAGDIWAYSTPILHCSERAEVPLRRRVLQVDFCSTALPGGLDWAA